LGHHFKTLLGTSGKVREMQQKVIQKEGNKLSIVGFV
jgi:predicted metalloprotease